MAKLSEASKKPPLTQQMENKSEKYLKFKNYLKAGILPLALVFLFVMQNVAFNYWLDLYSKEFFIRLVLVNFSLGIVLFAPSLFFGKKLKYAYLFLTSVLVSVLFSAQFLYFKYSESFLQFSAIKYFWLAGSTAGTVKTLLTPEILIFIANIGLVLLFLYFEKSEFKFSFLGKLAVFAVMLLIAFFGYKYLLYKETKEWGNASRLYTDVYDLNALVGKMGIINFSLEDTAKYMARSNLVSASDKSFLFSYAKSRQAQPEMSEYFGKDKSKNLIIIQVESLENAVINETIGGQEITPNLNKLASEGLYFDNYYAQVGPGNTADTEFSTMNSLYPLPDDVVFVDYAKNKYTALPQILKNNGYSTNCFHGDVPTFWNRSNIYPNLGYEKMFDLADFTVTRPVGKGPSDLGDEDLFLQTLPRLEGLRPPFMATVITMSSHTPFILPEDLETLQIPGDTNLNETQKNYLQSIHYTDKAIGEFIDGLKKDGLYDNSLIFVWGDHGSFTNISSALGDQSLLAGLANSKVPMIILSSGLEPKILETPGSHIDIFPTIANLLGVQPPKTILGQDLLNAKNPIVAGFNLVSGNVTSVLTQNLGYQANNDGVFEHGKCLQMPSGDAISAENCRNIFNQETDKLKASDIIVRGDLLNMFSANLTQPALGIIKMDNNKKP